MIHYHHACIVYAVTREHFVIIVKGLSREPVSNVSKHAASNVLTMYAKYTVVRAVLFLLTTHCVQERTDIFIFQ